MCIHVELQDGKPERKCPVWTKKANREKSHHWNPTQVKASKLVHVCPPQIESVLMLYIPPKKKKFTWYLGGFFSFYFQGRLMISGGCGASWVEAAAAAAANERWAGQMITIQTGSCFTGPVCVCSVPELRLLCCRWQRWTRRVQLAADHRAHIRPENPSGPGQVARVKTLNWKNSGSSNCLAKPIQEERTRRFILYFSTQGALYEIEGWQDKSVIRHIHNETTAASGFSLN